MNEISVPLSTEPTRAYTLTYKGQRIIMIAPTMLDALAKWRRLQSDVEPESIQELPDPVHGTTDIRAVIDQVLISVHDRLGEERDVSHDPGLVRAQAVVRELREEGTLKYA